MEEELSASEIGCISICVVLFLLIVLVPMVVADITPRRICKAAGWTSGATTGWFKFRAYCWEKVETDWGYLRQNCYLPDVVTGACELLWTEYNDN